MTYQKLTKSDSGGWKEQGLSNMFRVTLRALHILERWFQLPSNIPLGIKISQKNEDI